MQMFNQVLYFIILNIFLEIGHAPGILARHTRETTLPTLKYDFPTEVSFTRKLADISATHITGAIRVARSINASK